MTYEFNKADSARNICRFIGEKEMEYLPHEVTLYEARVCQENV